uniref:Uncharacterized protein n=1 Tax=Anguilla anguilla TaxID=7936 RepID=A0A0E9TXG6_ANGAN
MVSGVRKPIRR